jgi:thiamine kinase-like enzyme
VQVAAEGWARLPDVAPSMAELAFGMHADPTPLVDALATTPTTFLHGDWKMGNLGWHPEGRTILLDWAYLGAGPALWDLMWYLALNRARLPDTKEHSIDCYRAALEAAGVDTSEWWERQLGLAAVAIMVCFGWEKAVGDAGELAWWDAQVAAGRRFLD